MKGGTYLSAVASQAITIPDSLAVHLDRMRCLDDLRGFLDDVDAAEGSVEIFRGTELHNAALRRLTRLGFGPSDYRQSRYVILRLIFSPVVERELAEEVDAKVARLLAA